VKSDRPFLGHILDSIGAIENYVAPGRDRFRNERLIQDAVIRNFEIIGEAANRLAPETRSGTVPLARMTPLAPRRPGWEKLECS
jgi:uncharacterized protein with HEPN domain